jgi:hypothetical protein
MGEHVAHDMNPAARPSGMQSLGDRGLQSCMGVGDDKFDAPQAAAGQLAQALGPEHLGLGGSDVHANDLTPAVVIDADGDDDGDRDNTASLGYFNITGVQPDAGPIPSGGRVSKVCTRSSISVHNRLTWLFEMPLAPMAWTSSSTERVETP